MPRLKNPNHEKFAQNLVRYGQKKLAYQKTYPNANPDSARILGYKLATYNQDVKTRVLEILNQKESTSLETVINAVAEDMIAEKEIIDGDGNLRTLRDNPIRLEAKKILLKLHGALSSAILESNVDSRSVNINIREGDESLLKNIADTLIRMNERLRSDSDIQTGEIADRGKYKSDMVSNGDTELEVNDVVVSQ